MEKHTRNSLWELRRQRSVTHTNIAKQEAKHKAKMDGYADKLAWLEVEIERMEAEEAK